MRKYKQANKYGFNKHYDKVEIKKEQPKLISLDWESVHKAINDYIDHLENEELKKCKQLLGINDYETS